MDMNNDIFYLREANEVAKQARAEGNTPFGALLVGPDREILLRQGNIEITEKDCTGHAETALVRKASKNYSKEFLWTCSLYTTFEPCAMCCGAIYWGNIGRVVYGTTEKKLLELTGDDEQNPTFDLPCRDIFAKGQKEIIVEGPFPEFEAELGADKLSFEVSERLWNAVDAGAAIRQYAMKGFDIVIAHGAQYQSLLVEIAPDFPKTSFAYGTGFAATEKNIFAYDPHAQEGAFLLGILAGLTTKSNIIGLVGPIEAGDAIKYNKGFEQGAKSVNDKAQVRIAYTGSFGDLVAAGEIARTHIKAGADILTGTSQQTVGAINVAAEKKGLYWLSSDMDQKSIAPDTVLAAQVYNFTNVVMEIISSRAAGVNGGKHIELSLANGGLQFVFNDKIIGDVPPEAKQAVLDAKAKIIDGSLKVDIK